MLNYRWWLAVCILGLVGLGEPVAYLWPTRSRQDKVTEKAYEQIKEGMTQGEVEGIFGVSPGDYGRGKLVAITNGSKYLCFDPSWRSEWWVGDSVSIKVSFDRHGRVAWKGYSVLFREEETFWQRVRGWLPW